MSGSKWERLPIVPPVRAVCGWCLEEFQSSMGLRNKGLHVKISFYEASIMI